MKRIIALTFILFFGIESIFSQTASSIQKNALIIYEEENTFISPWINLITAELTSSNISVEKVPALKANTKDFSKYSYIIIYGAVMAFTQNEPIRDWLEKEVDFFGRKVNLIITAGTGDLEKYNDQLKKLFKKDRAIVVDTVTSATKKLSAEEKKLLVKGFVNKLE
jgi:hypothetical protein